MMNGVILSYIRRLVKNAPEAGDLTRACARGGPQNAVQSISLFFRIPLAEIGYVRAVVEAHEGLAYVRSAAANRGEIEWLVPEAFLEDARALAAALATETGLQEIPRPADWIVDGDTAE
jgi:hypothetical protein